MLRALVRRAAASPPAAAAARRERVLWSNDQASRASRAIQVIQASWRRVCLMVCARTATSGILASMRSLSCPASLI